MLVGAAVALGGLALLALRAEPGPGTWVLVVVGLALIVAGAVRRGRESSAS
jgi:hypothetical protein